MTSTPVDQQQEEPQEAEGLVIRHPSLAGSAVGSPGEVGGNQDEDGFGFHEEDEDEGDTKGREEPEEDSDSALRERLLQAVFDESPDVVRRAAARLSGQPVEEQADVQETLKEELARLDPEVAAALGPILAKTVAMATQQALARVTPQLNTLTSHAQGAQYEDLLRKEGAPDSTDFREFRKDYEARHRRWFKNLQRTDPKAAVDAIKEGWRAYRAEQRGLHAQQDRVDRARQSGEAPVRGAGAGRGSPAASLVEVSRGTSLKEITRSLMAGKSLRVIDK